MIPRVASVVVDFNGLADTLRCVQSLLIAGVQGHLVIVVDNGSTDDVSEALRAAFGDRVVVLRSERNEGYGAAANRGIRHALGLGASYVWVLNNDTVVEPGSLGMLLDAMDEDSGIGIASPQIHAPIGPDAPQGVWFAGGTLQLWQARIAHRRSAWPSDAPVVEVNFVTGCAMLLRREVFMTAGLFWEPLFLYWEDADLVLRAQRAGWRTCLVPSAWIFHSVHGSASESVASFYGVRNAMLVAWRNAGPPTVAAVTAFIVMRLARRWVEALLRRRPAPLQATRGMVAGFAVLTRWTVQRRSRMDGIEVLA